jgi:predicted porin
MKKSLFALAAVTAFAGAAQAQSSVTVYGIIDVGYVGGHERLAGPNALNNGNRVNQQVSNSFGASAQSTSRLGFRGTEDLGGGTRAFFTLETAILPNQTSPNSTNSIFGAARSAFVGMSQKGIGQGVIGLQNTVVTDAISPTITGQFNNIVGSMLFPGQTTSGTSAQTGINSLQGAGLANNSANGSTDAFTFRTSNTLKVTSERFAGIQASAMYVMQDTTQTQGPVATAGNQGYTGGRNNNNGWGLGLNYTFKKFTGTAAYQSLKATDPYNVTAAQARVGGIGATAANGAPAIYSSGNGTAGQNIQDNQAYVGATYDFGILKAYAGWIDRKVTSQINSNVYAKRTAQEIGVRGNWTPKVETWASIGNGRITSFGNNEPTANIGGWQLGGNYIMSKRTNLYAIYGQSGTSNVSNSTAGVNQSYNSNNYALGVRHTF